MDDHYCLSGVDLFRDLSRHEIAAIDAHAPRRTAAAGQVVYDPTRPVVVLFVVKRGRIRLFRPAADGRTITVALAGPGSIFGEMDLLGMRMGNTWAEALEPAELCLMSRADVRALLVADPRIATRILENLGARIADLEDRLVDLVSKSVAERVAATLGTLSRTGQPEADTVVALTHQQLAALVGATRERTTAALGELAQCGLVRLRRGKIVVRDVDRLAAYADGVRFADRR